MNPFILKGYKSPAHFCNRKQESETLIKAIYNRQDVTLFGYRRLGKSALIHHVFHQLKKEYICIYADIWGTLSVEDFTKELVNGIIRSRVFAKQSMSKKMIAFLKSLGASFSFSGDGLPSVSLIYNDRSQIFKTLEEVFAFLAEFEELIIFAIDEFQEIKKYDIDVPLEGKLRALTQQCNNVVFLFSGSEFHLLNDIFNDYQKPFYQSTRMLSIDKISRDDYRRFILSHFAKGKKHIKPEIIEHILTITHLHTYYVQAILNYVYSQNELPESVEDFDLIYREFILEKTVFYSELPDRLTNHQFALVRAFAQAGLVSEPSGAEFMDKSKIKSPSSLHRAFKSLLDKQLIIKDGGHYRLYDVFLEHFLKYTL